MCKKVSGDEACVAKNGLTEDARDLSHYSSNQSVLEMLKLCPYPITSEPFPTRYNTITM